ncbi:MULTISPECIES: hypothetical protein [unclassified Streptomyces]|uniref:hypothetical protein n=1 Tax=unclassified Streptomyces TaxID=2593676 RepID=UPI00332C518F
MKGTAPGVTEKHPVGALVIDMRRQRLGRVMGHEGPYLQLRPPGGGREWDADPLRVREAKGDEILRASGHEVSHPAPGRTP